MKENEFNNKNVLVTGSSRSIGLEIGQAFVKNGSNVIFTGTSPRPSFMTNDKSFYFKSDLTNEDNIGKLFDYTQKKFNNKLDILICNIGGGKITINSIYPKEEWDKTFNLNFFSTVYTIQKNLSLLKNSQNPSITCISSICSHAAIGCPLTYSVAKAALNSYVNNISKLIAHDNIRINSVSPGNILFPGSTWDQKLKNSETETTDYIKKNVPLKKFGKTKNITEIVLFLSSLSSNFTTGSDFVVDGGQLDV